MRLNIPYTEFKYLYPPRPESILTFDRIPYYEKDGWVAQYKKNGTCTIVAFDGIDTFTAMNRHAQDHRAWQLTPQIKADLKRILPQGKWIVLVGEIMHSKTKTIKNTIYFHDVIVNGSQFLYGWTFNERQKLLSQLLPNGQEEYSHYVITEGIWRARVLTTNLLDAFHKISEGKKGQAYDDAIWIDEGLVLKRPNGKLTFCNSEKNNTDWQAKVRYAQKNYAY